MSYELSSCSVSFQNKPNVKEVDLFPRQNSSYKNVKADPQGCCWFQKGDGRREGDQDKEVGREGRRERNRGAKGGREGGDTGREN